MKLSCVVAQHKLCLLLAPFWHLKFFVFYRLRRSIFIHQNFFCNSGDRSRRTWKPNVQEKRLTLHLGLNGFLKFEPKASPSTLVLQGKVTLELGLFAIFWVLKWNKPIKDNGEQSIHKWRKKLYLNSITFCIHIGKEFMRLRHWTFLEALEE